VGAFLDCDQEQAQMIVSVINLTNGRKSDADVLCAIRAINRQIAGDFAPYWDFGSELRLEGKTGRDTKAPINPADMRGDAILYLRDVVNTTDVDGYHERYFSGIPYGIVYLELSKKLSEDWTVTLSHEALELTGDAENNLLVQGPHPSKPRHQVFHWFEMCDAVQDESYEIDGIRVSNFVLPLYFTSSNERGGRNDFLGTVTKTKKGPQTLRSFSVNPGGYIGFFDTAENGHVTWSLDDDRKGKRRLAAKAALQTGRGQRRAGMRPGQRRQGRVEV
jgi:hypothetical protein